MVFAVLADDGTAGDGDHLGGDFPAFYGAGSIALDGEWESLYDVDVQQRAQAGLLDEPSRFLYFAYPPPVAALYAPLAGVDYRWAYLLHTLLMAVALWGAVALARPAVPLVDRYPAASFAVALVAFPTYRAVTGGENTALTLLLVVAALRFERSNNPTASGAMVGLLFYKPQFGVIFLLLLVVRRSWKAAAAASTVAAGMWALSASLMGIGWAEEWWARATDFAALNADLNAANFVSLSGALEHVFGTVGEVLGWVLAAVGVVWLVIYWWRDPKADPVVVYAFTAAVAVLALPQALFYEAGLLLLLGAVAADRVRAAGPFLSAAVLATWVQPISGDLGSLPLMLLVSGVVIWAARALIDTAAIAESKVSTSISGYS